MKRIGVDVGGTFTDLILVDEEAGADHRRQGRLHPRRSRTRRRRRRRALCEKAGVSLAEVDNLLHGTTIATNIVLTHTRRRGRDADDRGLPRHPPHRPPQEAVQLLAPAGASVAVAAAREAPPPPDGQGARDRPRRRGARAARRGGGARAASARSRTQASKRSAICLLHSYLNPEHERRIEEIVLEEFPEAYLSVSHEVLPLYREFERFSTVCLNAYVGPKVSRYVARFDDAMQRAGFARDVQLMQSSGGMATVESATHRPVNLLMSGPVAGLDRRHLGGQGGRARERRDARHRGHVGRHRRGREGRAADAPPARHEGRRLSGDGADGRHRHDRRGRRLDRLRRRGRRLPRRPAVGGSRPRAGVLRPRRDRADRDRRAAAAGAAPAGPRPARRRDAARRRSSRARRCSGSPGRSGCPWRRPPSARSRSRSSGWPRRSRSTPCVAGTTRASSPSWPPAARGRCSPATSHSSSRSRACSCPPHPGIIAATGLLGHGPPARVRRDGAACAQVVRRRQARRPLRASCPRRRSRSSTPTAFPRTGACCGGSPTAATPGRGTRSGSTSRPARSVRAGSRS